ncbi:MAG TPA: ABC transporter permease [Pyrinomonadaceae bacterium]|jgi:putative ABC transport system permease protein
MRTLLKDVRFAARGLWKRPGFTAVAVVTLALGIGANTAIFTVIDAALLRSLPYRDPSRLVHLWETKRSRDFERREASYPDFLDWRAQSAEVFEGVAGYAPRQFTLALEGEAARARGAAVTANFFDLLGVRADVGRGFVAGEDEPGAAPAAVLGHGLWLRRFGGDRAVVGRKVTLDGEAFTVVGVLPADFQFARLGETEVWTPLAVTPDVASRRYMHWLQVVARLKEGADAGAAAARMATVAAGIERDDPGAHAGVGLKVVPLQKEFVGPVRPVLFVLLGAVGFVLLIACTNVANLLLARSASRRREMAIRAALGASRWRVVRQLLTESVLLALAGGGVGLVLALWGVDLLVAAIPAAQLAQMPYLRGLSLDADVLLFAFGLSLLTGVLFGLTPALASTRADLQESLKEGGRSSGSRATGRLRDLLVVSEVALALVLLVGAGLLLKSLAVMLKVDPGFDTRGLLTLRVALPPARYAEDARAARFYDELVRRVSALPGVRGAAATSNLPLAGDGGTGSPQVVGRATPASELTEAHMRTVSANYFAVMGIPVAAGRVFGERDGVEAPPVLLVNKTYAERVFPGEDPVGRRLTFKWSGDRPPFEIVGVVGDEKVTSLDARTTPVVYFHNQQGPDSSAALVVRAEGADPTALAGAVREAARGLDPEVPVFAVQTLEQMVAGTRATFMRRYPAYLTGVFACVALLLALVGIYGVVSYAVTQRTHEIAVRVALGARGRDVLRLVLRHGLGLALAGVAAGTVGALMLTRLISGLLFGVSAADPAVYALVSLLLVAVALVASLVPARRATKVDPMVALRYE